MLSLLRSKKVRPPDVGDHGGLSRTARTHPLADVQQIIEVS